MAMFYQFLPPSFLKLTGLTLVLCFFPTGRAYSAAAESEETKLLVSGFLRDGYTHQHQEPFAVPANIVALTGMFFSQLNHEESDKSEWNHCVDRNIRRLNLSPTENIIQLNNSLIDGWPDFKNEPENTDQATFNQFHEKNSLHLLMVMKACLIDPDMSADSLDDLYSLREKGNTDRHMAYLYYRKLSLKSGRRARLNIYIKQDLTKSCLGKVSLDSAIN